MTSVIVEDAAALQYGIAAYAEYRFGFGRHLETGAKLDYKFGILTWNHTSHSFGLIAVADYKILPERKINPYIGIGAGPVLGFNNATYSGTYQPLLLACCYPRAGVELYKRLRISMELDIAFNKGFIEEAIYMPVCLNFGWIF